MLTKRTKLPVVRRLIAVFLLVVCVFCCEGRISSEILLHGAGEALHPAFYFNLVRRVCAELDTDLELVGKDQDLQIRWSVESDYILDQFLRLYMSINFLVHNKPEARALLIEDAAYLVDLVDLICRKYKEIIALQHTFGAESIVCLSMLVRKSEQKIRELFSMNQEMYAH